MAHGDVGGAGGALPDLGQHRWRQDQPLADAGTSDGDGDLSIPLEQRLGYLRLQL